MKPMLSPKKRRMVAVVFVALAGLCAAILFVGLRTVKKESRREVDSFATAQGAQVFFQFKPKDSAAAVAIPDAPIDVGALPGPDIFLEPEPGNFTDQIAHAYASRLAQSADGTTPEEVAQGIDGLIPQQILYELFTQEDVVTNSKNTEEGQSAYLGAYVALLEKHFSKLKISAEKAFELLYEQGNPGALETLADTTRKFIGDFLAVPVPSEWVSVHLEILNLWAKKETMYRAIARYENDPYRALIAMEEFPAIEEQAADLHYPLFEHYETLSQ